MGQRCLHGSAVAVAVVIFTILATGSSSAATGACSLATADQALADAGYIKGPGALRIAGAVACGDFLGPGRHGMAVTIANGTCWPNVGWVVFASSGGAWQRVPGGDDLHVFSIKATGSTLRETAPVYKDGDSPCFPSGGKHARTWRWNGSRLVAGRFKRVGRAPAKTYGSFYSPSRNIACEIHDSRGFVDVYCQSVEHPHSVHMDRKGRLKICHGGTLQTTHCLGDPGEDTPLLRYGSHVTVGRFRCRSREAGVTCVVVKTGKGFLIDRDRVKRVRP
jgi:hypothetical protein